MKNCPHCNADLTKENSVSREYVSYDKKSRFCSGHYTPEYFEPEESTGSLHGFDLQDDSDTCTSCWKKL